MDNIDDTYGQALVAVSHALDALAEQAAARAAAHDDAYADYDRHRHLVDCGHSRGAHEALAMVTGMLDEYRRGRSA